MRPAPAAALLASLVALPLYATEPPSHARHAAQSLAIGLGTGNVLIEGHALPARSAAAPTILLIGGLSGPGPSVAVVRHALESYAREPQERRALRIIAIALANPAAVSLEFPPQGTAYRDHPESFALWRWIGVHAPDRVLIAGRDPYGLAHALDHDAAAEVGRIPARVGFRPGDLARLRADEVRPSAADREMDRRRARSPLELARELGLHYGHDFRLPIYINAIALEGQLRLGHLAEVEQLVQPFVDGQRNSLARPNSLVFAGHIIFGELARRTHDPRYLARLEAAAAFGFEPDGRMKEAMPFHNGFSDSIFMGTVILAQAGALTGERRYFDMAARHIAFMRRLDLRPDGLYRHHPGTEAAWGRGNGFAAIGLALTLSDFPPGHPAYEELLRAYQAHMAKLLEFQDADGMWRNVIDYRGSYSEYSGTSMIAFAMLRGVERGWLPREPYGSAVQRAWQALLMRTGSDGRLVDVCESTAQAKTLEDYLKRAAILGPDPRGGAFALLLATEMAGL